MPLLDGPMGGSKGPDPFPPDLPSATPAFSASDLNGVQLGFDGNDAGTYQARLGATGTALVFRDQVNALGIF